MDDFLPYQQPTLQPWQTEESQRAQVKILVRREDQNHPLVSGNKWWKLKYNLLQAVQEKREMIVTFGGAYSNHIYATAAACKQLGLKSVGIIRGEETLPLNSTLLFARSCGMELRYVTRELYRKKSEPEFLKSIEQQYKNGFIIPEGGTNTFAIRGSEEWGAEILKTDFDYCCLPVGTGGTMAGIIKAFRGKRKIIGIPVLKDGGFLSDEINRYLETNFTNWQLLLDYHLGGYAKTSPELDHFIDRLKTDGIPTEFVYSGKLFWAVRDLLRKNFFEPGSTILVLHTGGLRPAM